MLDRYIYKVTYSRHKVHHHHEVIVTSATFENSRHIQCASDMNTTLKHIAFGTPGRTIIRHTSPVSSIIRSKYHQGIIQLTTFLKRLYHLTYIIIQMFNQGYQPCTLNRQRLVSLLHLVHPFYRRLQRRMGSIVGKIKKKGILLFCFFLDIIHTP